jgi:hypothetical protein
MCKERFQETVPVPDRRGEILTAVDAAEVSIARGEGRTITPEFMRQLAAEVKQRGRVRLVSEASAPR